MSHTKDRKDGKNGQKPKSENPHNTRTKTPCGLGVPAGMGDSCSCSICVEDRKNT